jgi:hypothetical protein
MEKSSQILAPGKRLRGLAIADGILASGASLQAEYGRGDGLLFVITYIWSV